MKEDEYSVHKTDPLSVGKIRIKVGSN